MADDRQARGTNPDREREQAKGTDGFRAVCPAADLPARGQLLTVLFDGDEVVIANVNDRWHAIHGVCEHAGAPLGSGFLFGCELTCPLHGWTYDVSDGWLVDPPLGLRITSYRVRVVDGTVELARNP